MWPETLNNMLNVGNYSARTVWRNMAEGDHVLTVGLKTLNIFPTKEVQKYILQSAVLLVYELLQPKVIFMIC